MASKTIKGPLFCPLHYVKPRYSTQKQILKFSHVVACQYSTTPKIVKGTPLNEFGKKVFLPLVNEQKNVVLSPLSIYTALSMLAFGARGVTRDEIEKALHLKDYANIEPPLKSLLNSFKSARDAGVINLANNTFLKYESDINEKFVADLKHIFHSELVVRDFFFDDPERSAQ